MKTLAMIIILSALIMAELIVYWIIKKPVEI